MANPRIVPEDQARPGDRIADLTIHEPRANIDALGIDKHVVKLGEPFDALLCLQGGALRAIYSAGVLDTFLDMGLSFKQVVGVSAGTLMGIDYVCGDRGASAYTNLVYAGDPRYMGFKDLIFKQQIFNFDFMFGEVASYLMPFDPDCFFNSPMSLIAVATNCTNGTPSYFDLGRPGTTMQDMTSAASASSSMPLLSKMTYVNDVPHLDGGITDPLGMGPAREAIAQGRKVVFVSTRERGFRKPPESERMKRIYRRAYAGYPELAEKLCRMNELCNEELAEADELAAAGKAFVIHPIVPPTVRHTEKDTGKLRALYEQGAYEARAQLPALIAYLQG